MWALYLGKSGVSLRPAAAVVRRCTLDGRMQKMAINHPIPVACPFCKKARAKRMAPQGDYAEFYCPTQICRAFRISGTTQQLIDNGADRALDHFVTRDSHCYLEV